MTSYKMNNKNNKWMNEWMNINGGLHLQIIYSFEKWLFNNQKSIINLSDNHLITGHLLINKL